MAYFFVDVYFFSYSDVIIKSVLENFACAPLGMKHLQLKFDYMDLLYLIFRPFLVEQQKQG